MFRLNFHGIENNSLYHQGFIIVVQFIVQACMA